VADVALSSTRNPRVRAAAALRERRSRDEAGLTLIDGSRELARAVAGGARVVEVYIDRDRLAPDGTAAVEGARATGAEILEVSAVVVDHLAYGDRGDGLVAVARIPDTSLDALALPTDPLVVVVERVEKPGNLGAVLRSADGAGADAVIAADPRTDLFNPNTVRASQGTVFAVPVAGAPSAEVLVWLRRAGLRVLAARVGGTVDYTEADLRGPVAIVLGSEAAGLSDAWSGADVAAIGLPMLGIADSLNVSIAAAVLLYEARRQRGGPRDGRAPTTTAPGD
jgi:TrmH family RNA methyltransferase